MAVAIILDFPGGTKDQYDATVERMALGGQMPDGGVFHAAGSHEDGFRVIDVWRDLATFERFRDEKIGPITAEVGMARPEVMVVEVAEQRPGSGRTPALVQVVRLPGLDADSFREMDSQVVPGKRTPDAITFHVNGPIEDGWCVIDAWDSKEARDQFIYERVMPAAQNSAALKGAPVPEDLMVEATLAAATKTVA